MQTVGLHPDFGVEVLHVDLRDVTASRLYPEIRALFEQHSLLLFRGQRLDEPAHRALAELFGPLEDLRDAPDGVPPTRPMVSNAGGGGGLTDDAELRLLDLKSNFFWHTDSSFLPTPAISNILLGCTIPAAGGDTEFVSTRAGWARLPEDLKARARDRIAVHSFAHSRALVDARLAEQPIYTKFRPTCWRMTWRNPRNGAEALFLGAHAAGVRGLMPQEGARLIEELTAAVTGPEAIYSHRWRVGDVLIWDERATLHRGTPWDYREERTLASFVSSARESDGIASARP
ncbi:alpha-ketoglutarate-dependent 2,4-dichlorophenoxyacetate dioxygenase [Tistlia consotensis]|uniref:Alpha-ketoglutarate-dependent 2,4-dichlorophenoxyacetate dioxygenase n=1 Tax=Tistlia consotensis USBA 355 TaxID=560819 RepID=A0A1Y6CNB5_9PROT|nr:TauD/TfdA family dioxygenase [Tistlia consotensis]SMF79475.1 alpha-ketoglutarate-dependent 2,4-dichlorophenoxyacetate dioxygenase [Tistlia consotensis USBA 355]SNS17257.1 alpha-ketoglutarate-dependent 2,4-dichlorophenoxyacetate dioxygenase [Tistlia consotensis]